MPNVESINVNALSAVHRRTLTGMRRQVLDAARSFGQVRERLTDLAPKVVRLYNGILAENEGFTFVEFVRLFDPSVPTHAADRDGTQGYRNHRTYYTLAYMRRLVQQQGKPRTRQGVRDSAADDLARTLATILSIVPNDEHDKVWGAVQSEFQYTERIMTRLRKRVDNTKPVIKLALSKPAHFGSVVHMERATVEQPAAEPMAQSGRRVTMAAEPARKRTGTHG